MTEANDDSPTLYDPSETTPSVAPDWLLSMLNHVVSGGGWDGPALPVVLIVDGATVSGTMISPDAWIEAMAEAYEKGKALSGARMFRDTIRGWLPSESETEEAKLRHYLHLKDVVILRGDGGRITMGAMRVRSSHVAGWTVGSAGTP